MDVTWQSLHRNAVDKTTKQYWFGKLQHLSLGDVTQAFDSWLMTSSELPTLQDIIKQCRPKEDFYKAIGKVRDEEIDKAGLKEIENFVSANLKPKRDKRAWAKKILANPKDYPYISVKFAKESLNMQEETA